MVASSILGIKKSTLEIVILNQESIVIDGFEFRADNFETSSFISDLTPLEKGRLIEEKKINKCNYTIYKNDDYIGKFSFHYAGHFAMTNDKNSTQSHLNTKLSYPKNITIESHIFYNKLNSK